MAFVGMFNTGNFTTDLAKKSFAGMITRLMPNGSAPLFGLTSMLTTEVAVAVEHGYFSKTMLFPELKINGAVSSTTETVLTVDSTSNVLPGMTMRINSTGENILIDQVLSSTTVKVVRGLGVTAAAAIADDAMIYQVGSAFEEGSDRPSALNITPVRITNLTQIFRNTWALTDTARATQVIAGETTVAENKQDCAAFHAADIEKALFFGQKSQGTRNGKPFRTMDGILSILDQYVTTQDNVHTAASTTNYTQLETMLDPVFNQATDPKIANERVLFVGGTAKVVLNNIGRLNGTYQLVDGQTSYGLQFSSFKTARGTFRMIEHPLFNTNVDWAKMAVAVDLSTFNVAYLGDRKTRSEEEFGEGVDAVGGSLTTEMTCLVKNPAANAVIYGFTAAAAG